MRNKSILTEAKQIERAVTLIHLGAACRCRVETDLSYHERLLPVQEVAGKSRAGASCRSRPTGSA